MKRLGWLLLPLVLFGCAPAPVPSAPQPAPQTAPQKAPQPVPQPLPPAAQQPAPGGTPLPSLLSLQVLGEDGGWLLGREEQRLIACRITHGEPDWRCGALDRFSLPPDPRALAFFVLNESTGWVAAPRGEGRVAVAQVGGQIRAEVPVANWETGGIFLDFISPTEGWMLLTSGPAMGTMYKSVYQTTDGGATWTLLSRGPSPGTAPTPAALPESGYATGLGFQSAKRGFVTQLYRTDAAPHLYRTDDGGRRWRRVELPYPESVPQGYYADLYPPRFFGPDRQDGLLAAVFRGQASLLVLYRTHDGGETWSPGAAETGSLQRYAFADAEHGWILDPSGWQLYVTADGGRSWQVVQPNRPLERAAIQFTSARNGWALLQQEDGSSRLLRTTDGGKSWTEVQVLMRPTG